MKFFNFLQSLFTGKESSQDVVANTGNDINVAGALDESSLEELVDSSWCGYCMKF